MADLTNIELERDTTPIGFAEPQKGDAVANTQRGLRLLILNMSFMISYVLQIQYKFMQLSMMF